MTAICTDVRYYFIFTHACFSNYSKKEKDAESFLKQSGTYYMLVSTCI